MNNQATLSLLDRIQKPSLLASPLSPGGEGLREGLREGLQETLRAVDEAVDLSPNRPEWASRDTYIDRVPTPTGEAHPDAIAEPIARNPTVANETGGWLTPLVAIPNPQPACLPEHRHDLIPGGPRLLRDRRALLAIVRFRLLPFQDVHAQIFGVLHKAVVTRRMQALERQGYITVWEERLVVGGHPRYAIPTKKGLTWALAEFEAEARGMRHEKLLAFMRGVAPRPLTLQPYTAPPFLPHQLETNREGCTRARNH